MKNIIKANIKGIIKDTIKGLTLTALGAVITVTALTVTNNSIRAEEPTKEIVKEEIKEEFNIYDTYVNNSDSTIVEFTDGSYAVINVPKNYYEFYPVELFDYEVIGQDREQLHNIIKSYMMGKYNLTLEEVDNHEIFNNKNL